MSNRQDDQPKLSSPNPAQSPTAGQRGVDLWGGHFADGPAPLMEQINASIGFDKRLYLHDLAGSKAHARMLAAVGLISDEERDSILSGLEAIKTSIEAGEFDFSPGLEDIHMNIEARLTEAIGEPGRKLHTARSRNDQVATDFRLWLRDAVDDIDQFLKELQRVLLERAEAHHDWVMPGFTHLQAAQPVTFGHHLMAYVEMFGRDRGRFLDGRARLNECPLGAAALAGTSFPIDRRATAAELAFDRPMANSLDAVSDRDFALEFLSSASIAAIHLSRLAEELVLWSTPQFGFIRMSEAFSSGSSIMPQKRNPDAAELLRGKSGRVVGSLNGLLMTLKGLPLAYSKDMQEDKEPVFDAVDTLRLCLAAATAMIETIDADRDAMRAAAGVGYTTATDLADWMVRSLALPFREAHAVSARAVRLAEQSGVDLAELSLEQLRSIDQRITPQVFDVLTVERSVASRTSFGGTAPSCVLEAVANARLRYL
ncbi:MAG: argininosuccinate lyase [Pseudomonadota bacterium]